MNIYSNLSQNIDPQISKSNHYWVENYQNEDDYLENYPMLTEGRGAGSGGRVEQGAREE